MDVGVTVMLSPEPNKVPPQEPLYQRQRALLPRLPPLTFSVVLVPLHTESRVAVMEVGAVEAVFTLMDLLTQDVLLQVPSALR